MLRGAVAMVPLVLLQRQTQHIPTGTYWVLQKPPPDTFPLYIHSVAFIKKEEKSSICHKCEVLQTRILDVRFKFHVKIWEYSESWSSINCSYWIAALHGQCLSNHIFKSLSKPYMHVFTKQRSYFNCIFQLQLAFSETLILFLSK